MNALDYQVEATCPVCKGIDELCQNCGGSGTKKIPLKDTIMFACRIADEYILNRKVH